MRACHVFIPFTVFCTCPLNNVIGISNSFAHSLIRLTLSIFHCFCISQAGHCSLYSYCFVSKRLPLHGRALDYWYLYLYHSISSLCLYMFVCIYSGESEGQVKAFGLHRFERAQPLIPSRLSSPSFFLIIGPHCTPFSMASEPRMTTENYIGSNAEFDLKLLISDW